jgi:uroporphyrinogen-III synthase
MSALAGKRVVNTRAVHQAGELDELLRDRGAIPLAYPCIAIEPPADTAELDKAIADFRAGRFDWLAITSANSVQAIAKRAGRLPSAPTSRPHAFPPPRHKVAVVGPGTAEAALRELGLMADVVPHTYRAIDLAAAIPVEPGQRVLIPQSEIAAPDLAEELTAKGAIVTTVTAYRTVTGSGGVDLPALLARNEVDAIVFASSSAVDGFFARLAGRAETPTPGPSPASRRGEIVGPGPTPVKRERGEDCQLTSHVSRLTTVCIGPNTAGTARSYGLTPIVPAEQTLTGIIDALEAEFAALSKGLAS